MTSGKKQVDVCLTSAPSSSFSSGTPLIRLRNAMHSRHEVERWYKEIEPIIKTAHSRSRRSTEGIERPPKFEINGPNDVESIECLRNYYKKRVNDQKQFLESINNRGRFLILFVWCIIFFRIPVYKTFTAASLHH